MFFQFWQAWEWFRNLSDRSGSTKKQEFIEIWNLEFSIFWWDIRDFRDLSTFSGFINHHGWSWGSYGEDVHGMGWWYAISDFRLFFYLLWSMQNISTKSGNYQTTKLQIVEKTEISKKMTLFYIIQAKASIPVRPSNSDSVVNIKSTKMHRIRLLMFISTLQTVRKLSNPIFRPKNENQN